MYYAVIFTSTRTEIETGYAETAIKMLELAKVQPGFMGVESARNEIGYGFLLGKFRGHTKMENQYGASSSTRKWQNYMV